MWETKSGPYDNSSTMSDLVMRCEQIMGEENQSLADNKHAHVDKSVQTDAMMSVIRDRRSAEREERRKRESGELDGTEASDL